MEEKLIKLKELQELQKLWNNGLRNNNIAISILELTDEIGCIMSPECPCEDCQKNNILMDR